MNLFGMGVHLFLVAGSVPFIPFLVMIVAVHLTSVTVTGFSSVDILEFGFEFSDLASSVEDDCHDEYAIAIGREEDGLDCLFCRL
jgi:hypothetical protein